MIEVNNLTARRIDKAFLEKIAEVVLNKEKKKKDLSIALVGSREISRLNKKYRKKDRPTDVLSFSYGDSGEIVICPEVVESNARTYQFTFKKELSRILIHGILHILGYNHKSMAEKQIRYLKLFIK